MARLRTQCAQKWRRSWGNSRPACTAQFGTAAAAKSRRWIPCLVGHMEGSAGQAGTSKGVRQWPNSQTNNGVLGPRTFRLGHQSASCDLGRLALYGFAILLRPMAQRASAVRVGRTWVLVCPALDRSSSSSVPDLFFYAWRMNKHRQGTLASDEEYRTGPGPWIRQHLNIIRCVVRTSRSTSDRDLVPARFHSRNSRPPARAVNPVVNSHWQPLAT